MKKKNLYTEMGEPKRIRCYMLRKNPHRYIDYITVVYTYAHFAGYPKGTVLYRAMDNRPTHPAGYGRWDESQSGHRFCPGGSRVRFFDLPEECQELVRQDYKELWEGDETAQ